VKALATPVAALALAPVVMGQSSCEQTAQHENSPATAQNWAQVQVGMSETDVRSIMGEPDSTQHFENAGLPSEDCWYYGFSYQACFDGDSLTSKNKY
jgi:outer membrane protein assembly factor BamE (lipoprotein component of BamABCDE complex)